MKAALEMSVGGDFYLNMFFRDWKLLVYNKIDNKNFAQNFFFFVPDVLNSRRFAV